MDIRLLELTCPDCGAHVPAPEPWPGFRPRLRHDQDHSIVWDSADGRLFIGVTRRA